VRLLDRNHRPLFHTLTSSKSEFLCGRFQLTWIALDLCGYLVYAIEWGQRGFVISLFSYSDSALLGLEMMTDDLMNCSIPTSGFSVFGIWIVLVSKVGFTGICINERKEVGNNGQNLRSSQSDRWKGPQRGISSGEVMMLSLPR
jgi:hypothetical protein